MNNWEVYDNYCHNVLGFLYANRLNPETFNKWTFATLHAQFPAISMFIFEDIIAILYNDGFIDSNTNTPPTGAPAPLVYFSISIKGVAFVFRDNFEKRRKRDDLQLDLLHSQNEANESTLITNKHLQDNNDFLKKIFVFTLVLTILSLILSAWSLRYASLTNQREQGKEYREAKESTYDSLLKSRDFENHTLKTEKYFLLKKIDSLNELLNPQK